MTNTPLVSAYVISYRRFDYLFDSIQSILNQDYPNIELLIFDDSSPNFPYDEVKCFIEKNKKENIKNVLIITHPVNLGTVENVNSMIKNSRGEYLIGLSTDDEFYKIDSISTIVDRMILKNANLIITKRIKIDKSGTNQLYEMPLKKFEKKIKRMNSAEKQNMAFLKQFYYDMASGSCMYFSREMIYEWGLFDTKYILWEDGPFLYQYTKKGFFLNLEYDIISKKYREGGISTKKNPILIKDHINFYKNELLPDSEKYNFFLKRLVYYSYYRILVKNGIKKKNLLTDIKYIESFVRILMYKLIFKISTKRIYKKENK